MDFVNYNNPETEAVFALTYWHTFYFVLGMQYVYYAQFCNRIIYISFAKIMDASHWFKM